MNKKGYISVPINRYLHNLAARTPTPGGGSAAGLSCATGVALLEMACRFTISNKNYVKFKASLQRYLALLQNLRQKFMDIVDEDIRIYISIHNAFKSKDKKRIDKALKKGYYISVKLCNLARHAMEIGLELSEKGSTCLITDVGGGMELLEAGFNIGRFNTMINLGYLKDKIFIKKRMATIKLLEKDVRDIYNKGIKKINERM